MTFFKNLNNTYIFDYRSTFYHDTVWVLPNLGTQHTIFLGFVGGFTMEPYRTWSRRIVLGDDNPWCPRCYPSSMCYEEPISCLRLYALMLLLSLYDCHSPSVLWCNPTHHSFRACWWMCDESIQDMVMKDCHRRSRQDNT